MQKIILFYRFTPIKDPEAVRLWQKALCEKLHVKGRIILSEHGINGTLGGELAELKAYVHETKQFAGFKNTVFKWSGGRRDDFPRLSVKVRPEIVTFGAAKELQVDEHGVVGGGTHLRPEALHQLVAERGDEVVFFDGRNAYEAAVGRFKDAVVPETRTSRDFIGELESGKYDHLKAKPVVTYCTGGIRCEVLSALMKNRGFQEVYQLDGGIVKYGETYGDAGLWEGSLYVFDGRMGVKFSDAAADIGSCVHCHAGTSRYDNCANRTCNQLILVCEQCAQETYCPTCGSQNTTSVNSGRR